MKIFCIFSIENVQVEEKVVGENLKVLRFDVVNQIDSENYSTGEDCKVHILTVKNTRMPKLRLKSWIVLLTFRTVLWMNTKIEIGNGNCLSPLHTIYNDLQEPVNEPKF